jgi:hypothetical protein
MSMTPTDVRQWHALYERLGAHDPSSDLGELAGTIDNALHAAQNALTFEGLQACATDEAEALVAAITRYALKSNPELYSMLVPGVVR